MRATLKKNGYTVQESDITLRGEKYRKIWIDGYATREAAQAAAAKIGALLKLKPEVLRQDAER
ncbi:hypothetical protein D3C71_2121650 [compost metagenome]